VSPNLPGIFSVSRRCPDVLPEHRQQQTCTVAQACQQHHLQTYGSRVEPHHCTCWLCSWSQHKIPCQPAPKVPILALLRYAAYACCESTYMPSISHRIDPRALQHPAVQQPRSQLNKQITKYMQHECPTRAISLQPKLHSRLSSSTHTMCMASKVPSQRFNGYCHTKLECR
jgi:hypothetical protein